MGNACGQNLSDHQTSQAVVARSRCVGDGRSREIEPFNNVDNIFSQRRSTMQRFGWSDRAKKLSLSYFAAWPRNHTSKRNNCLPEGNSTGIEWVRLSRGPVCPLPVISVSALARGAPAATSVVPLGGLVRPSGPTVYPSWSEAAMRRVPPVPSPRIGSRSPNAAADRVETAPP